MTPKEALDAAWAGWTGCAGLAGWLAYFGSLLQHTVNQTGCLRDLPDGETCLFVIITIKSWEVYD